MVQVAVGTHLAFFSLFTLIHSHTSLNGLFGSLEREESRGEEMRVELNDNPPPYLDVFKISKGEGSN